MGKMNSELFVACATVHFSYFLNACFRWEDRGDSLSACKELVNAMRLYVTMQSLWLPCLSHTFEFWQTFVLKIVWQIQILLFENKCGALIWELLGTLEGFFICAWISQDKHWRSPLGPSKSALRLRRWLSSCRRYFQANLLRRKVRPETWDFHEFSQSFQPGMASWEEVDFSYAPRNPSNFIMISSHRNRRNSCCSTFESSNRTCPQLHPFIEMKLQL